MAAWSPQYVVLANSLYSGINLDAAGNYQAWPTVNNGWWLVVIVVLFIVISSGCSSRPVIQTQIVEKPVAVPCRVNVPGECSQAYALDKVSPRDEPLTINRAMRIELEQRAACQVALLAAIKGCNQ